MPMLVGIPVHFNTVALISLPTFSTSSSPSGAPCVFSEPARFGEPKPIIVLQEIKVDCEQNQEMSNMIALASNTLDFILENRDDAEMLSCISFDYMMGFGYLIGGWLMHKGKVKAKIKLSEKSQNENFLKSKIISAEFFDFHILPRVESHFKIVTKGATIVQITDDSFV